MRFVLWSVAVLVLFISVPAIAQDLTIVSKVTRDGGPPQTSISYISSDHVRMSHGDGKEMIVDFKTGQMTTLDSAKNVLRHHPSGPRCLRGEDERADEQPGGEEGAGGNEESSARTAEEDGRHDGLDGYPLANTTTVNVMGHKSVVASEVTEVKRGPIPASAWEIPAGYTKVDNPMLKALQSHPKGRS